MSTDRRTKADLESELEALRAQLEQSNAEQRVIVGVRIPVTLRDKIRDAAHDDNRELQDIHAEALRNWLRARDTRMKRHAEKTTDQS